MKGKIRFGLLGFAALALASAGIFGGKSCRQAFAEASSEPIASSSEVSSSSSEEPASTVGHVVIDKAVNGAITVSVEGEQPIGTSVTLIAKPDVLYKIEFIKLNGVQLVEDEEISGKYVFSLVAGENRITSSFVLDGKVAAGIASIIEQLKAGDWTQIFSVENVVTIVKWIIDGGVLIAFARYFIKNKRLEKKVEEKVESTMTALIPNQTKETVMRTVEEVITPIFAQVKSDNADMKKAMAVFAKCFALSQDNSPESKKAIIDELATVSISDTATLAEVKAYIDEIIAEHDRAYKAAMAAMDKIDSDSKAIIGEAKAEDEKPAEKEDKYGAL